MPLIGSGNSLGGIAGSNSVARLLVVISGNAEGLSAAVAQAEGSMQGLSANASRIGSILTRSLTLPLLAVGGASIKLASDFQTAMARVAGLTPVLQQSGKSLSEVSDMILQIASQKDVVATPTQLADALYFAGSAGLTFANAMEVVQLSAKGASIGMGDAEDVSKVLIFALNNFGPTGLTAAHAMDVLTESIKQGTAEPADLAIALGRLLPIARQAGLSFDQVAASVAVLTNLGIPTRVATTSLRALFSELLAPTQAATNKLNEFGISAEQLRAALAAGTIPAFQLLIDSTHGNVDALHDIIPQIRGFTSFVGLSADKMSRLREVQDAVTHSTGSFQQALDQIVQTPGFQFQKSLQELQIAGIELGQKLMPVFITLTKVISDVASAFQALPSFIKTAAAAFIVLGASIGPVLQLWGALTATREMLVSTAGSATMAVPTLKALATGFAVAGIAAVIAAGAFVDIAHGSTSLTTMLVGVIGGFVALRLALVGIQTASAALALTTGNPLAIFLGSLSGGEITAIALALAAVGVAIARFAGQSARARAAAEQIGTSFDDAAASTDTLKTALDRIQSEGARTALEDLARSAKLLQMPANIALPQLPPLVAADTLTKFDELVSHLPVGVDHMERFRAALVDVAANGGSLQDAFSRSGQSLDDFINTLGHAEGVGQDNFYVVQGLVPQVIGLSQSYDQARESLAEYNANQEASLMAHTLEGQAVEDLAKQYGVSVPYMQSKLDELGVSAAGMSDKVNTGFGEAAFGVDANGKQISGAASEAADAVDKAAADMAQSLQQSFNIFGELPAKFKTSIPKLLKNADQITQAFVDQATAIRKLNDQNVPTGLINQLIGEGPDAVKKFADATDSQIQRAVTSYEIGLGAMDEAILREGAHQEVKGRNIVQGFTTAMLSQRGLLVGTGGEVVKLVQAGLNSGKIKPSALNLIRSFANTVETSGLPKAAASHLLIEFTRILASGKGVNKAGQLLVHQISAELAKAKGVSRTQATQIVSSVAAGIASGKGKATASVTNNLKNPMTNELKSIAPSAFNTGLNAANSLAQGITAGQPAAVSAAQQLAQAVKAALDGGMHNSPRYSTYYLAQRMVNDFNDGLQSKKVGLLSRPVLTPGGRGDRMHKGRGGVNVNIHMHGGGNEDQLMRSASRHFSKAMRDGNWD